MCVPFAPLSLLLVSICAWLLYYNQRERERALAHTNTHTRLRERIEYRARAREKKNIYWTKRESEASESARERREREKEREKKKYRRHIGFFFNVLRSFALVRFVCVCVLAGVAYALHYALDALCWAPPPNSPCKYSALSAAKRVCAHGVVLCTSHVMPWRQLWDTRCDRHSIVVRVRNLVFVFVFFFARLIFFVCACVPLSRSFFLFTSFIVFFFLSYAPNVVGTFFI